MLFRSTADCEEIRANDGCRLRELLHPDRDDSGVPYSFAVAWIDPGGATDPHHLTEETEVYFVLGGQGRMHVGDQTRVLAAGDLVVVPPAVEQWVENTGVEPLQVALVVSPPWRADHDRLSDTDRRP